MEDFVFLTDEDKNTAAYNACVAGSTAFGIAFGSLAGAGVASAPGALFGGVVGFGIGLAACPHLKEPIKKKLFSAYTPLTDQELMTAMQAVQSLHPSITKSDAIQLLAELRADATMNPNRYLKA